MGVFLVFDQFLGYLTYYFCRHKSHVFHRIPNPKYTNLNFTFTNFLSVFLGCNCHGHSDDCYYDAEVARNRKSMDIFGRYDGGGVCRSCQHNTAGNNCERCKPTYYRVKGKKITDVDACQPCNCNARFSTGMCADETGQCQCKANYAGRYCNQCAKGYSPYPACERKLFPVN